MKRILLLLLLVPFVFAQPTSWFDAQSVTIGLNVSSDVQVVSIGPNPFVEWLRADVLFVPQNSDFVAVRELKTVPSAAVSGGRARFEWNNPSVGVVPFSYSSVIEVANSVPRVRSKILYPMKVPQGFERFVEPTKHIDSKNPAVIGQAHLLAKGEDDLFVLVSKIAMWVKSNVKYDLSTLTAEVSQPASWVLENRYGVCDELTSLFIAMLRSLNIPARFVSGLAYTANPDFPGGWGAHGWAEVYFPGVGWVPFDPTFGEFGWVDPGHLKLKESLDPQEPTTVFEWRARDVKVNVRDLELSAAKLSSSGRVASDVVFSVSPLKSRVGFGGYNGVVAVVENLADYYVGVELSLTKVSDMDILDGEHKQVVLPPRGRGSVFWIVKLRPGLDPGFQYELPLVVYSVRGDSSESSFASGKFDIVFSLADVESGLSALEVSRDLPFDLACALESDMVWSDSGRLDCFVQSRVDEVLPVAVCRDGCTELSVPARGSVPVSFDVPSIMPGPHEVEVVASSGDVVRKAVLTLVRLDPPRVVVNDVKAPESVAYGEQFALSFLLARESVSFPQNVTVEIKGGGASAFVDVGELVVDQEVNVNIRSDQLYSSSPDFVIDVSFKDPFNREYGARSGVEVQVSGMPWYKKIIGWFVDLF